MNKTKNKHSVYVLIHGAWHGGWCWKKVKEILESEGHSVYTSTLTGLGERSHLLSPQINLSTHIEDIVSMLEYENLYNVILVGHSYAGMVITGVAEKMEHRISQLLYLDAFLPENGKSITDYLVIPSLDKIVKERGEGWKIPFLGKLEDLGVTKQGDLDWAMPRCGDQPLNTFTETIKLTKQTNTIPKTFIRLSNFPWFIEAGERAKRRGFDYLEMLSGGHDAMINIPEKTARVISNLSKF